MTADQLRSVPTIDLTDPDLTSDAPVRDGYQTKRLLRDNVDAAYAAARRHVFDQLAPDGESPALSSYQRAVLARLSAAEEELRAFRDHQSAPSADGPHEVPRQR